MYWSDPGNDKIQRANLDGSDVEDVVTTGLVDPRFIALTHVEPVAIGRDADGDGCVDTLDGLADLIANLPADDLARQMRNPLTSKIDDAADAVATGDICGAVAAIEAFTNQVRAQRGKKIADATADLLLAYADNLIAGLLASLPSGVGC
jgi:hypothetical protein